MAEEKKTWEKPELIIINNCHIQENVLANCNEGSNPACGPSSWELNNS
ncbi:MAG: hypothetical protein MI862_04150 [Desulfobacterales bacterium]|nr:hypothetical protein [Desulfobacterales bacterium]